MFRENEISFSRVEGSKVPFRVTMSSNKPSPWGEGAERSEADEGARKAAKRGPLITACGGASPQGEAFQGKALGRVRGKTYGDTSSVGTSPTPSPQGEGFGTLLPNKTSQVTQREATEGA